MVSLGGCFRLLARLGGFRDRLRLDRFSLGSLHVNRNRRVVLDSLQARLETIHTLGVGWRLGLSLARNIHRSDVHDLLDNAQAPEQIRERIAQRERARPHLQHALRICRPRPLLVPEAGPLGILDREGAHHRRLPAPLDAAGGNHLAAADLLDLLLHVLAERMGADDCQHGIAPHRRTPVDDRDVLERGHRLQAQLATHHNRGQHVPGLALVVVGNKRGLRQQLCHLHHVPERLGPRHEAALAHVHLPDIASLVIAIAHGFTSFVFSLCHIRHRKERGEAPRKGQLHPWRVSGPDRPDRSSPGPPPCA